MGDLYFNELSVDFTFSVQPKNEEEAKKILLQFIQTYFAYKVCAGLDTVSVLSNERLSLTNILNVFRGGKFYIVIDELEEQNLISDEQKKTFKAAIVESFDKDTYPEFMCLDKIAYGLGMAFQSSNYAISYSTNIASHNGTWNQYLIKIQEHKIDENDNLVEIDQLAKNITTITHVVEKHEIWEDCKFINNKPSSSLLPKKESIEFIVKSYVGKNWKDFYSTQQQTNITIKKKIGRAVARINGWVECTTTDHRLTFKAGNRYLAVDTENSTFEYFKGTDDHQGEIKFHEEIVDIRKARPTRKITLVN